MPCHGNHVAIVVAATFNALVHVFMYSHYLLATFKVSACPAVALHPLCPPLRHRARACARALNGAPAVQIKTWWRQYLTQMQLVQFVCILVQSVFSWIEGPRVGYPDWIKAMLMGYMITMLYLFGSFYVNSYAKPKGAASEKND